MPSTFPLEIEEIILDLLADEDDKSHSALKTCSLVCQAFLPICRKRIFGSIALNGHHGNMISLTTHAFERLLRETPEITDYIRKLDYTTRISSLTIPSIQESLKRISRLEFLSVRIRHPDWSRHDRSNSPIRIALLHLLHLPTLTHFEVNFNDFLVSDLIRYGSCTILKHHVR